MDNRKTCVGGVFSFALPLSEFRGIRGQKDLTL
jgi:hypothetical protein